jgi:hypothetical protein
MPQAGIGRARPNHTGGDIKPTTSKSSNKGEQHMATIQLGPSNSVTRDNIRHTDDISAELIEFLGGDPENVEYVVGGVAYTGPLTPTDLVDLRPVANTKG